MRLRCHYTLEYLTLLFVACASFLDLFIEKVFSGECVPTFLWNYLDLFSRLREVFLEYDNSIVSTAKQLKHELRLIFALPGEKNLCLTGNKLFTTFLTSIITHSVFFVFDRYVSFYDGL